MVTETSLVATNVRLHEWAMQIKECQNRPRDMKVYSMIETAKANELDPHKYLNFLLEHRPSAEMTDAELEQFAPWGELAHHETCN